MMQDKTDVIIHWLNLTQISALGRKDPENEELIVKLCQGNLSYLISDARISENG